MTIEETELNCAIIDKACAETALSVLNELYIPEMFMETKAIKKLNEKRNALIKRYQSRSLQAFLIIRKERK